MNHKGICFFAVLVMAVNFFAAAQDKTSENADDISRYIVGTWEMTPNEFILSGSIEFRSDGTYEMHQDRSDGGVTTKGEYRIDGSTDPARIDLCLEKCDAPGSEWTTRFCIVRMLEGDKLEIQSSPDGNYPTDFSEEKDDVHNMVMARKG